MEKNPDDVYVISPAARFEAASKQRFGYLGQNGPLESIRKYLIGEGESIVESQRMSEILESWCDFAKEYFKKESKDAKNIKYPSLIACIKTEDSLRAALRTGTSTSPSGCTRTSS